MSTETIRTCDYCRRQSAAGDGRLPLGWVHISAMRDADFYDFDCCDKCIAKDAALRMILGDPQEVLRE